MSYFSNALDAVVRRSFGGKLTALGQASGIDSSEIGRLIREITPLTIAKLTKLCEAVEVPDDDKRLLCTSAVRDLVPEPFWSRLFGPKAEQPSRVQEPAPFEFHGTSPVQPRAAQVLRYLIAQAEKDPDVVQALILLGKFLELPDV